MSADTPAVGLPEQIAQVVEDIAVAMGKVRRLPGDQLSLSNTDQRAIETRRAILSSLQSIPERERLARIAGLREAAEIALNPIAGTVNGERVAPFGIPADEPSAIYEQGILDAQAGILAAAAALEMESPHDR